LVIVWEGIGEEILMVGEETGRGVMPEPGSAGLHALNRRSCRRDVKIHKRKKAISGLSRAGFYAVHK